MIYHRENITLIILVLAVYLIPLGDSFSWQAELTIRSAISMCLALFALSMSRKPCALILAGCEIIALLYNVVMAFGYSLDVVIIDRFYDDVMASLFTTEIVALLLGMVGNELRRIQQHRKYSGHIDSTTSRHHIMG